MSNPANAATRRQLRNALLFVGALLFLVEEWLWVGALRFFAWLDRRPTMRWIERRLAALPAAVALVVLCVPVVMLFPFKIFGLWLMGTGRFFTGCLVMLIAKIVSTGIVARIFLACRPQLMEMAWFARLYVWLLDARDRIHAWLAAHPGWHAARRTMRRMRAHIWAWTQADASSGRRGVLSRWRLHRRARRRRELAARPQR
jgi:hypothetical protein